MRDPKDTSEVTFPDIGHRRASNTDLPFVHRFESGRPGPHTMITALVHGNEVAGVHCLEWLLDAGIRPDGGVLSLGYVNAAAYGRFDPADPLATRAIDEDLNRLWDAETLDGPRDSAELRRARELRAYMGTVDRLLDLHSMVSQETPVMMAGPLDKGRSLAETVGLPEWIIMDAGHAAGRRMRDYAAFGDPAADATAILLESGPHFAAEGPALAMHVAARFLAAVGTVAEAPQPPLAAPATPARNRVVRVDDRYTVQSEDFAFTMELNGLEVLEAGREIARDGGHAVTTPFEDCVIVMPGRFKKPGETAVRFGRLI